MDLLLRRYPGLRGLPHVDLGVRPTPVEEHRIDGLTVLVKREDLSSKVCGGNKVRCLEFLLARPARRVLTFSTLGAHHAYATAVHAAGLGLETDASLVRQGRRGALTEALSKVAARVVEVGGTLGAAGAALALWRPGTRIVAPGGMSPRGALGYLVAALELDHVPPRIYVPLGTGTTISGLLAGLMLREAVTEVVGVRVISSVIARKAPIWQRAFRALYLQRRYDRSVPRPAPAGVRLRIVTAPGAYAEETPGTRVATSAAGALDLEPAYTAKTLAVLLAERAQRALYVHTYAALRASARSPSS